MCITNTQLAAIALKEKVRVHLCECGEARVISWSKGAEWSVHEVGNGRGTHQRQLGLQNRGCIVPHTDIVTESGQV